MASQVHPIPYFTPSIFNFPPKCNTCLSQNELGTFPITSGNLPPLWVHCITIYHFHEAKILEAVLELQASLFSFPYTLIFSLKSYQSLLTFLKYSPSSISAICPGSDLWLRLQTRLLTHLPSSVSAFKSFLMRILKHKPHPVTRLINLFLHPKYPQTSACLNKHTLKWPVPKTSLPKSWSWSHFNQTKIN